MNPIQPASRLPTLATVLLLLVLMALHVALFGFATLVTDSGRDLANAWAVGHGGPYPVYGPGLFGHWKLGPVWFWILALPLRLSGNVVATAVFVGVLAAAKIPLAYALGRRLVDARLGLIAAALIALPGWDSVGTLVIAHTSVVESAMLATVWLALVAWQERRATLVLGASLMLALALHAHPTALLAAPAVAFALWRAVLVPRRWGWLAACVVVFVVPFLPALLAEMQSGWPQATATLSYLDQSHPGARLARLPQVLWALIAGGPWFAARFLLPAPAASLWWLAHGVLLGVAILGGVRLVLNRFDTDIAGVAAGNWFLVMLPSALAAVVFIVLLRDATPTWMVYSLAPFGVFLLALGWHGLLRDRRGAMRVIALLALASIGTNMGLLQQRIAWEKAGRVLLPGGSIGDITSWRTAPKVYSPWLSVRQFDALARETCVLPGTLVLHGELAMTFDFSQGVAARLHCPIDRLPRLGGRDGDRHLMGISAAFAQELGFTPGPHRYGHLLRVPRQVLAPEQGRQADVDVRYRLDRQAELDAGGDVERSGSTICGPDELLVLTNLMPLLNRFEHEVTEDSQPRTPQATTHIASYYACDGQPLHWRIRTPDPAAIDIVVVALRPD